MPPPIDWAVDQVSGLLGGAASAGFDLIVDGIAGWVMDAVMWVVGGVFNFFMDAQDPNVQADWFVTGDGPYATTAAISAVLMVGFLFAGITQGALAGDTAGMARRMVVDLPLSVLGMVGLVTVTQALIRLTDELSSHVMTTFQDDISDFTAVVATVSRFDGGAFVVILLGLVTVVAGIVLVAELAVRAALVYIVVAFAPLVFAARLWPAMQGVCRKLLQLLAALILSKLVMAVALAVAASAAVGSGSGGEVTGLPEPEVVAEDPGGSVTQAVGILLAAAAAFGVAAFSPLLVARLLPLTESAAVGQGLRGSPLRAAHHAVSTAHSAQWLHAFATRRYASGPIGGGGQGSGPAAATAGLALVGAGAVASVAARSAQAGVRRGAATAHRATSDAAPWVGARRIPNQEMPAPPPPEWREVPPKPRRRHSDPPGRSDD